MTHRRARRVGAVAVLSSAALLLAACVPFDLPGPPPVDREAAAAELETRLAAEVPGADDVLVGVGADGGPDAVTVLVRLYVRDTSTPAMVEAVEETYRITWSTFPAEPRRITVQVSDQPKPADAAPADRDGIELTEVGRQVGVDGIGGARRESLIRVAESLTDRYGQHGTTRDE